MIELDYTQNQAEEEKGHKKWVALLLLLLLLGSAAVAVGYAYTATFTDDIGESDVDAKYLTIIATLVGTDSDGNEIDGGEYMVGTINLEFDTETTGRGADSVITYTYAGSDAGGMWNVDTTGKKLQGVVLIDNLEITAHGAAATPTVTVTGLSATGTVSVKALLSLTEIDAFPASGFGTAVEEVEMAALEAGDSGTVYVYAMVEMGFEDVPPTTITLPAISGVTYVADSE